MPQFRLPGPILVGLLLAAGGGVAGASQTSIFNYMRDTPIAHFSTADMNLMQKTIWGALDNGADGTAVSWNNPATNSGGIVTPMADPQARKNCRAAQVDNHWRAMKGSGSYLFCRNTKSKSPPWQLVSPL